MFFLFTKERHKIYKTLFWAGVITAIYSTFICWRYLYYGALLPNTFAAKTGDIFHQLYSGIRYVLQFILGDSGYFMVIIMFLAAFYLMLKKKLLVQYQQFLLIAMLVGGYCCFIVIVGGDWMPGYRFIAHIIPLVALLWIYAGVFLFAYFDSSSLKEKYLHKTRLFSWGMVILCVIFNMMFFKHSLSLANRIAENTRLHSKVAIELKKIFPSTAKIAVTDAGVYPFYTGFYTIDMVGLLDKHIASLPGGLHQKFDLNYVLEQKPDLIQTHLQSTFPLDVDTNSLRQISSSYSYPVFFVLNPAQQSMLSNYACWRGDKELYSSRRFWNEYAPFLIVKAKGNSYSLLFARKDWEIEK